MFTWICPQCGREVPPSYTECPDCAAKAAQKPEEPVETASRAEPPPTPATPPPRPAALPPRPAISSPVVTATHRVPGPPMPIWQVVLFCLIAFGLGALAYWAMQQLSHKTPTAAATTLENAGAKGAGKAHPLQKFIEVTGVRLNQGAKKNVEAKFVLVNHSGAEIADLAGTVTIWARTAKSEEDSVGTFTFKPVSLGPYESKELTAPVNTKLKTYELPDWQNVTADVQLSSP